MKGNPYNPSDNHPGVSLIYLLLIVLLSALLFSFIGLGLGILVYGVEVLKIGTGNFDKLGAKELNFISLSQIFSAIGTFIIPAVLLNRIEKNRRSYFDCSLPNRSGLFLLVILIMIFSAPFFEFTVYLNEQMELPSYLKGVEEWMREKEEEMAVLTKALLTRDTIGGLLTNLFMIGVLAAVGEELLFRGCLQNIVWKWTGKIHIAIWLTAFIFSAIHLQFFGFLPRMLIGALCGYLYFWGKSIWLPILAHFANNASAIIIAFYLTKSGKPLDYLDGKFYHWPIYVTSFIIGLFLIDYYRKYSSKSNI
ncbi:CPBP family intramembrane metalloprotease [Olivibacter sp. SDN3]|uniref:CPBP family intramembrane glutamic endopeptidase n=1 Tax=Olivibacter sp. SDN3 TaxID=2764720 RepID=UPI001650D75A|nr:CPBP family intramembrane glutamic endopeptidase [Olivibacter sp. SDN3]QNL51119.1 CPBP family intramembrane metalloprotease [Olivibacter sp. SDN3]